MNTKYPETFWRRRLRHMALFGVLLALACAMVWVQYQSLTDTGFTTGYSLLVAMGILTSYTLKKRCSFLRFLGTSSAWLHAHVYLALGCTVFFFIHIGFRFPDGILEQALAAIFLIVSGSGMTGLYMTRRYPVRLAATRQEYVFELIPVERSRVVHQAETLLLGAGAASPSLGDFYQERMLPFLVESRSLWFLAFPTGRRKRSLLRELRNLDRYLPIEQRSVAMELGRLIQNKDDLDFHYALQGQLKLWLFVHIGFTLALLVLVAIHTVLVHAFDGGAL